MPNSNDVDADELPTSRSASPLSGGRAWFLIVGLLVIFAAAMVVLVSAVRTSIQQTVQPAQELAQGVGTQVSEVLNPTPTILPDPVAIINNIQSLSRLETVQYSIERVIAAETGQGVFGSLFGDKLLFVAHGVVIAGIDLAKVDPTDLWVSENVLYFRMPDPEIFIATLDNEKSYVYDRETGLLTKGDINLETDARRVAEDSIQEAALEDGILVTAGNNAEAFMSLLLRDLGYPAVIFAD